MTFYPELAAVVGATVPNYQGMFLRGYGSQSHNKNNGSVIGNTATNHSSGNLGAVQGDGIRDAYGFASWHMNMDCSPSGVFTYSNGKYSTDEPVYLNSGTYRTANQIGQGTYDNVEIRFSRSFPIANEMRPANVAVKWLIFAKE